MLGLYSIFRYADLAHYAPSFAPNFVSPFLVLVVGVTFVAGGYGIATGKAVARGATAIALVWVLMAIFSNVLSGHFDVREFFVAIAFIGASLMIKASVVENQKVAVSEDTKATPEQE